MGFKFLFLLLCSSWAIPEITCTRSYRVKVGVFILDYILTDHGISVFGYDEHHSLKISGILNSGQDSTGMQCDASFHNCTYGDVILVVNPIQDGIQILWESQNVDNIFKDCFDFGTANWYGGPERSVQKWPLEKLEIDGSEPYVIKKTDNFGVAERYWLNSNGIYIYLEEYVPLYVEQNLTKQAQVCFTARVDGPYVNRNRNILDYKIILKNNPREAHLHAVNNYLGQPTDQPNREMIIQPIWTTWAKYKRDINDETVLSFAKEIRNQGYTNGQLEIDDQWEVCYGAQEFSSTKFANITDTVAKLKDQNFRVTLWIHPFVNSDCQNNSNEGIDKGYFVKDVNGNTNGSWWNGNNAHQIDFTNPEAVEWFSARLRKLQQDIGIDSFKFDAGETNYAPEPSVYYEKDDIERIPNLFTEHYIRACAEFGDLIEVRSAFRTQDLPVFVRMMDKDSSWGEQNGLYTLITTLLQMNLNGYPLVLPDMIGGNGYSIMPDAELLVRWTQANTFMPAMQFSYLPWEITSDEFDAAAIVKKFVKLHEDFSSEILDAMYMSVKYGWPVNPPVWWVDPTNIQALAVDDEYLVGDSILVAPVIEQGATTRKIFLPTGGWIDGNNGTIYEGPQVINAYPAHIDVLPYFFRIK